MGKQKNLQKLLLLIGITAILAYNNCSKIDYGVPENASGDNGVLGASAVLCQSHQTTKKNILVAFPDPGKVCDWGPMYGNLEKRDGYAQARREQVSALSLPPKSTVCDLQFNFTVGNFLFDDHFIFTFDGVVLATSNKPFLKYFATEPHWGYSLYNWELIKGVPSNNNKNDNYCIGTETGMSSCHWPTTDKDGSISMTIDSSVIQRVADSHDGTTIHNFSFITTGDDNPTDCQHRPINFTVEVEYVDADSIPTPTPGPSATPTPDPSATPTI